MQETSSQSVVIDCFGLNACSLVMVQSPKHAERGICRLKGDPILERDDLELLQGAHFEEIVLSGRIGTGTLTS